MNRVVEFMLIGLALAGMYCAIPKTAVQGSPAMRAEQQMVIADGSDPMPLCRGKNCQVRTP